MNRTASAIFASGGVRIDETRPLEFQVCHMCEVAQGDNRSVVPTPIETDDARFEAWVAYLSRWSLTYPCRLQVVPVKQPLDGGRYYLRIEFAYPDERDSRDGVSVLPKSLELWPPSEFPDVDTPRWLRANIMYHLNHELDEHMTLDGVRVFDPHHNSVYTCETCEGKLNPS